MDQVSKEKQDFSRPFLNPSKKLENERLLSLIEFAQQTARLKFSPTTDINKHNVFHRYEHQIYNLPGIQINPQHQEHNEVWITVERLVKTNPPTPDNHFLQMWLENSDNLEVKPSLKKSIVTNDVFSCDSILQNNEPKNKIEIKWSDVENPKLIEEHYQKYLKEKWITWSIKEKNRRKTIKLYNELFTLKQQLEGSIDDEQIELIWGTGVILWKTKEFNIRYPLLTHTIEIFLNEKDKKLEIRPRTNELRIELEIYESINNLGVNSLEKSFNKLNTEQTSFFSPFDKSTYESVLRLATTHLTNNGIYWPDYADNKESNLPTSNDELKVTGNWVIFARPRNKSIFLQDLEKFKKLFKTNQFSEISNVLNKIISEPSSQNKDFNFPNFRGSLSYDYKDVENSVRVKKLFFPLSYNEEQVNIVKKLDNFDGVVVQGPPGTGKSHTIANIISHYMALGKRVLVTSMKEPALSVLKEKLPKPLQPLAISLLTNEQDGTKQFEFSIFKIAQKLQEIDSKKLEDEINAIESCIDQTHANLSSINRSISNWAKTNIEPFTMDGRRIFPLDAAQEIEKTEGEFDWLKEDISLNNILLIDNKDVIALREARQHLKNDLIYLEKKIPSSEDIPNLEDILFLHNSLLNEKILKSKIEETTIFPIENKEINITSVERILLIIEGINKEKEHLKKINKPWVEDLKKLFLQNTKKDILNILENLFYDIKKLSEEKNLFLEKPIKLPNDLLLTEEVTQAIYNMSLGKRPFGMLVTPSKRKIVKKIDEILIFDKKIKNCEELSYVHRYILYCHHTKELNLRWNNLVNETSVLSKIDLNSNFLLKSDIDIEIYFSLKNFFNFNSALKNELNALFNKYIYNDNLNNDNLDIDKLKVFLKAHLDYSRYSKQICKKEKILDSLKSCNGVISEEIKRFIAENIGNPLFIEQNLKSQWNNLENELIRIRNLKPYLETIDRVSNIILKSGGANWSRKLRREPPESTFDNLLPSNWQQVWNICRLRKYLQSIDNTEEFKTLISQRRNLESQLAKAYESIVIKHTWLQLAIKATPDVRSALQAFRSAILKIGKGTGKRAIRYRRDAKSAALLANKAIPCWIMPHYRISETLPAQFGCFDLVIIDEASQSDLSAFPAILRANKLLIVGDDKQVSPGGIGLEEEKINSLMLRFLAQQVESFKHAMSPERSIFDLCKIVFADSQVMLLEHFRCVPSIIEYSKREFYNHELKPLRLPKESERLDPPLVDVLVQDGYRNNKENKAEARFIVDEIKKICNDPKMSNRTIGIVSLLGNEQPRHIWEILQEELSPEVLLKHQITCGDALTFQGKERDIMFLSMVVTKDNNRADSRDASAQRFNVAASRARDKMYLVRSIELDELSPNDKLRRNLIEHFFSPFAQDEHRVKNLRELCESDFEREVYDLLTEQGYRVIPQVKVGSFRIDMVVEGNNDERLAIECDGDRYHDVSCWDEDMNRQRILERAGWKFWRSFASTFVMNRKIVVKDLFDALSKHHIEPIGGAKIATSIHSEHRKITVFPEILETKNSDVSL